MKTDIPETVTTKGLADLLGLTTQRIGQLEKSGVVFKTESNRYNLQSSVKGYIDAVQHRRLNQHDGGGGEAGGDYEVHRARLTSAKADMAQIQAETMKGNFHEAGAVEAVWIDMLMNCRSKLLAIPSKLTSRLRKETSTVKIKAILETAVTEALNELSNYDPDLVLKRYLATTPADVNAEADDESPASFAPTN